MCVFGRPIRDFIPISPGHYQPQDSWQDTLILREAALRQRHMKETERLKQPTKRIHTSLEGRLSCAYQKPDRSTTIKIG